jgi:hypothetical protein
MNKVNLTLTWNNISSSNMKRKMKKKIITIMEMMRRVQTI